MPDPSTSETRPVGHGSGAVRGSPGAAPEIRRSPDCGNSPKNARAEDIALALMGAGALDPALIVEGASWDRPDGTVTGRAVICATAAAQDADRIRVEQVVTHGRAGSVSGRVTRADTTWLFCHVIRFTGTTAKQIAQLVSFEHRVG